MMDVRIFDLMEQCTESEVQNLLPLVSEQRREQALSFRFTFGQFASLKSYVMLKEMTGLDEIAFEYGEHGKPSIMGHPEVHFNISHCKKAIAVAVSDRPVGIDVESCRSIDDSLLQHTMNGAEISQIQSDSNTGMAFLRFWTRKEAVLKLKGTGIIDDLKSVLCCSAIIETHEMPDYVWSVACWPCDNGQSMTVEK